jgi:ribonuclease-3
LTHKSWLNENPSNRKSNERLEFLGDAVLDFVVAKELFLRFPNEQEGFLSNLRSKIVNTQNLAQLAEKLDIGRHIYLSKGEVRSGGANKPTMLENTLEAIIGAIYLDSGLIGAEKFIKTHLFINIEAILKEPLKNSKGRLQETTQAKGLAIPKYSLIKTSGPDHDRRFWVEVSVDGKVMAEADGKTILEAEKKAAEDALVKIRAKG